MREAAAPSRTHHLPAAGTAALAVAVLVAGPSLLDEPGRLGAVLLVQLVLVAAWVRATGLPGGAGAAAIGVAAAVGADLALMLPERPRLGGLLTVLGGAFLAVVVHQMLRRPRSELVASLSGAVLLVCAVSALAALLLVERPATAGGSGGGTALVAVGAALVAGSLTDSVLPRPALAPEVPRGLLGVVVAVLAGAAVLLLRSGSDGPDALPAAFAGGLLGATAAVTGLVAGYVVAEAETDGARSPGLRGWAFPVVQALLPVAACAPVVLALHTTL